VGHSAASTQQKNVAWRRMPPGTAVAITLVASAAKWKDRREDENPAVVSAQASRLKQTMDTARGGGVDFVFIDTAGRKDDSALNAARASDLVLIPTRPSNLTLLWAMMSTAMMTIAPTWPTGCPYDTHAPTKNQIAVNRNKPNATP
jgi:hypothetical protein